jgi:hypothetical protein
MVIQGGSNMTGTKCDFFTHKSSRSYLNHLVIASYSIFNLLKCEQAFKDSKLIVCGQTVRVLALGVMQKPPLAQRFCFQDFNSRRSIKLFKL